MSIFSPLHIVFFAAIALLVLGPKRFPEFTRMIGNGVREFREVLNGVNPARDLATPPQDAPPPAPAPAATAPEAPVAGEAEPQPVPAPAP